MKLSCHCGSVEAEINSTFLRFCVDNFNGTVLFETIINMFWFRFTEQFLQIFKKFLVFVYNMTIN
mgnify:CR=1 FL=1